MLAADSNKLYKSLLLLSCTVTHTDTHTTVVHHLLESINIGTSKTSNVFMHHVAGNLLSGCSHCCSAPDSGYGKGLAKTETNFCCSPFNTRLALLCLCRHGQQLTGRVHQPRLPLNHPGSQHGVRLLRLDPNPHADTGIPAQAAAAGLPRQVQGSDHTVR